jgi:hypothetical protein
MVVAWSTFGPHAIGAERFATVSSGRPFAQVAGPILRKQAQGQNPDKDEVAVRSARDGEPRVGFIRAPDSRLHEIGWERRHRLPLLLLRLVEALSRLSHRRWELLQQPGVAIGITEGRVLHLTDVDHLIDLDPTLE